MSIRGWPSSQRARSMRRCSPRPGSTGSGGPISARAIPIDVDAAGAGAGRGRDRDARRRSRAPRADRGDRPSPRRATCVLAERGLLAALQADCHSPVAALATIAGDALTLRAELLAEDGSAHVAAETRGAVGDDGLAGALARDLLDRAPPAIRRAVRGMSRALAVLRPEPGNAATAGADRGAGTCARSACRCSRFAPLAWDVPDPAAYDALIADQRQHAAPRRRGAGGAAQRCPCSRSARRRRRRRARPGSSVVADRRWRCRAPARARRGDGRRRARCISADASGRCRRMRRHRADRGLCQRAAARRADGSRALDGPVALLHSARAAARLGRPVEDRSAHRASPRSARRCSTPPGPAGPPRPSPPRPTTPR